MIPVIQKPPINHRRKAAAITVAGIADFLQIILFPALGLGYVLDDFIDFATAIALTAICGFKWQFIFAFFLELIPGLDLLPTWSAVALLIPSVADSVDRAVVSDISPGSGSAKYPVLEGRAIVVPPVQTPPS